MNVLMLNGSWNADGSTKAGLDIMAEIFAGEGVDTEIVSIGGQPVRDCIACGRCSELGRCVFDDDAVNAFARKARGADGFVFGTPVYYAHPSGRVLSFLDRLFFSSRSDDGRGGFHHKPAASTVVARRGGCSASYDGMNKYFGISNMIAVGSTYWNDFHALTKEDVPKDAEGVQTLENLARNMVWLMKCLRAGRDAGISTPEIRTDAFTNFVR